MLRLNQTYDRVEKAIDSLNIESLRRLEREIKCEIGRLQDEQEILNFRLQNIKSLINIKLSINEEKGGEPL